jgi:hypothetical protein
MVWSASLSGSAVVAVGLCVLWVGLITVKHRSTKYSTVPRHKSPKEPLLYDPTTSLAKHRLGLRVLAIRRQGCLAFAFDKKSTWSACHYCEDLGRATDLSQWHWMGCAALLSRSRRMVEAGTNNDDSLDYLAFLASINVAQPQALHSSQQLSDILHSSQTLPCSI